MTEHDITSQTGIPESIPWRLLEVCRDNGFDNILVCWERLTCDIRGFDAKYLLEVTAENGKIRLRLSDRRRIRLADGFGGFSADCIETDYPLIREEPRDADWQTVLDDLRSAGDDLFGLLNDIAGACRRRRRARHNDVTIPPVADD